MNGSQEEETKLLSSESSGSTDGEREFEPFDEDEDHESSPAPRRHLLNPLRYLRSSPLYQRLPTSSAYSSPGSTRSDPQHAPQKAERRRAGWRLSNTKEILLAIAGIALIWVLINSFHRGAERARVEKVQKTYAWFWQRYDSLDGYFNGVRTLVPVSQYKPQNRYNQSKPSSGLPDVDLPLQPPLDPVVFDPYPDYKSEKYPRDHVPRVECYLDTSDTIPAPNVYAYQGLPERYPRAFFGSSEELGLSGDKCFDRFGRLAPYGLGFNQTLDLSLQHAGADRVFNQIDPVNYTDIDWGVAQKRCHERNQARFTGVDGKERVPRHAYILRCWMGYKWDEHKILNLRAIINELALKSGAEYDVHLLVHVKNESIPIWANKGVYKETLQSAVPKEFWNIATLWSEPQMKMYYPASFKKNFANYVASTTHKVYRSPHFALQWFGQQHPEYDFFWNWEMDLRYTGHYYEFNSKIGEWAKNQPRKGLWERNQRFWIPEYHGDFQNFTQFVEDESSTKEPIWGPVRDFPNTGLLPLLNDTTPPTPYDEDNFQWGVGEEADLLVFNPIFDPSQTNWVERKDVTGYSTALPIPPRRAAIITAARLSKRLLDTMHTEVWQYGHTMFPEMFPATACLHHGLKAVYVPHPAYFENDWDLGQMDKVLNRPRVKQESPFGFGEHNLRGGSFYYNAGFGARLWRRWLGFWEDDAERERWEGATGRMCLPPMLVHPVKYESKKRNK